MSHLFIRISDNVLDQEDWTIGKIFFCGAGENGGTVIQCREVHKGIYALPDCVGWRLWDVWKWQRQNITGSHPENYYMVASSAEGPWFDCLTPLDISELIQ